MDRTSKRKSRVIRGLCIESPAEPKLFNPQGRRRGKRRRTNERRRRRRSRRRRRRSWNNIRPVPKTIRWTVGYFQKRFLNSRCDGNRLLIEGVTSSVQGNWPAGLLRQQYACCARSLDAHRIRRFAIPSDDAQKCLGFLYTDRGRLAPSGFGAPGPPRFLTSPVRYVRGGRQVRRHLANRQTTWKFVITPTRRWPSRSSWIPCRNLTYSWWITRCLCHQGPTRSHLIIHATFSF